MNVGEKIVSNSKYSVYQSDFDFVECVKPNVARMWTLQTYIIQTIFEK